MALFDSVLNLVNKKSKVPEGAKPFDIEARQASEAKMKDRAGMVISIFALILAVNSWYGNKLSSQTLNNTIAANDVWSFYEAKSIKQILAQQSLDDAIERKQTEKIAKLEAKIARYESEPATGDGKKELMAKARKLEEERDRAKQQSPWIGFAGTLYQLSIVVLSASILAVSMSMFWGSFFVAALGLALTAQGVFLFI
jgi:cytochrome c556